MIHIDIDPAEIGKNRQPDVPIVGDVATVLDDLIPEIQRTQPFRQAESGPLVEGDRRLARGIPDDVG